MLDHNFLKKYASQPFWDMYYRRIKKTPNGVEHDEIEELFKSLTIKHGHRLYRLKDVSYFSFEAEHFKDSDGTNIYTVVYFKIQKDAYSEEIWQNITQRFRLNIIYNKNLGKYNWSGWCDVPKIEKNKAVIFAKDFKFNSTINFSTKDVYIKGESHVW